MKAWLAVHAVLLLACCLFTHTTWAKPAPLQPLPRARGTIAVINCVPFHLEILLGTASTLRDLGYNVVIYGYLARNAQGARVKTAMRVLRNRYTAADFVLHSCQELILKSSPVALPDARAVVFVSGQEDVNFHTNMFTTAISRLRPRTVLAVIHNTRRHPLTASIQRHHQPAVLLGLSERVHHKLTQQVRHTTTAWVLPTMPLGDGSACIQPATRCHTHFTIQGTIAPKRRNYGSVQAGLTAASLRLRRAGILLKIVGAAEEPPHRPAHLAGLLEYFTNLGFHEFYHQVHHSIALVPAVASREYIDGTRITSTVVTALITGVPILADRDFMAAYSFLPPSSFYEHFPHEDLPTAMLRVAALPVAKHMDVRRSLLAARQRLQGHNMLSLQEQLMQHT